LPAWLKEKIMTTFTIKPARYADLATLREIELAAFETLREAGAVTGMPTATPLETLNQWRENGLLYVAYATDSRPVGFAGAYVHEEWLHIAEADVHPDWQRQGIGRCLLLALLDEGRKRSLRGASLTTDRDAAFNAPFYASLGFTRLEGDAIPLRIRALLAREADSGLDPARRIAMALRYDGTQATAT